MCKTTIITTTEQANAMLESLERQHQAAQSDQYATERKKPIRSMECCCCGNSFRGRQWFNQDCGYGLGDCCVEYCGVKPDGGEDRSYGVPGIHFLIPKDEKSPIDHEIGRPIIESEPRLRIDCQHYVYWKGIEFEHWCIHRMSADEIATKVSEMVRRCEHLESIGVAVSGLSVIWHWEKYEPKQLEWKELWDAMKANPDQWIETTESMATEMLGAVPPIGAWGFFLVGEPNNHNEQGEAVYAGFRIVDGKHFARYLTVREYKQMR
jgi:hypothetical protein